ncbi:disks large-associated protein, putative [Pediculus humanus corporis]|uniref:Disks large-associated protein, putative n=1 Tax=Pediculus humanus subsp. corporis TaxID=121224 RepID=E0VZ50_PEDHC|nr:disks large-associated protein, putative [Pediculus humanus corporis]EEB18656.1 disks large-associated protein, putative [Pediculus humanus corporis]
MILTAEHELEDNDIIPEDVKGKMRVGVGKAKMLLKKKFRLFEELCSKNLGNNSGIRYPVTTEDLAGFWDTILIQLIQIYKIFEEVENCRKNNWEVS